LEGRRADAVAGGGDSRRGDPSETTIREGLFNAWPVGAETPAGSREVAFMGVSEATESENETWDNPMARVFLGAGITAPFCVPFVEGVLPPGGIVVGWR
jgi:hypothetical protein